MNEYKIPGILLLYDHPLEANAPTIMEHVNAFKKYSSWPVWSINCNLGFPKNLESMSFEAIILHYSLFGNYPFVLTRKTKFDNYIKNNSSIKIAFMQDEYHYCPQRFSIINKWNIDLIYSLLNPCYHYIYIENTKCKSIHHTLTGYVDVDLIEASNMLAKKDAQRSIDIGYRARPLPLYMGRAAQEKTEIAEGVLARLASSDLITDIKIAEADRIYGKKWHEYVANCHGMLGVEAGVSIFDIKGEAQQAYNKYLKTSDPALQECLLKVINSFEGNIYYRTISPRIFECAAFRTCMILFEGNYQGILKPMEHYIPLKKDFSNFDFVIRVFQDSLERRRIVDNVYNDLIASGCYSYENFINNFDKDLIAFGMHPSTDKDKFLWVDKMLNEDLKLRLVSVQAWSYTSQKLASCFPAETAIGEALRRAKRKISDWSVPR